MPERFDPYHTWLGIPPEEQPANLYRLLAIKPFEDDPNVIENAADQRMAHLRSFQSGKRAAESQRLLNEVSAARVALLSPEKKQAYDEKLRAELAASDEGAGAIDSELAELLHVTEGGSAVGRHAPSGKRRWSGTEIGIAAAAIGALVVLAVVVVWMNAARKQGPVVVRPEGEPSGVVPPGEGLPGPPPPPPKVPGATEVPGSNGGSPSPPAEPGESVANPALVPPGEPLSGPVDLLAKVDPARDAVRGEWRIEDGVLLPAEEDYPLLEIPVTPPEEYDLVLDGERLAGQDGLMLGLVAGGRSLGVLVDGYPAMGNITGVEEIDGKRSYENESRCQGAVFVNSEPFSLRCAVRKDGLTLTVDGRSVLDWEADYGRCSQTQHWSRRDPQWLALGACASRYRITRLLLVPPGYEAMPAERPGGDAPAEPVAGKGPAKLPIPDADTQKAVAAQLGERFDFHKERSEDETVALFDQLLDTAEKSPEPAERFVLLRAAANLAQQAGDAQRMLRAAEAVGREFDVDVPAAKQKLLLGLAGGATTTPSIRSLVEHAQPVIDELMDAGQYDAALELATAVYQAAGRSAGRDFRKQAYERRKQVQELHERWAKVRDLVRQLETEPDDPAANLAAGRWYAFEQNDWQRGLPCLAKGSDPELAKLAQRELTSPPEDPNEQLELAGAWWDLSETATGAEKEGLMLRAGLWYEQAQAQLPPGLARQTAEAKLAEIAKLGREVPYEPGTAGTAQRYLPRNRWIDLLPAADLQRDAVCGSWTGEGPSIHGSAEEVAVAMLPAVVEEGYDLEVEFTRQSGDGVVAVILPVGRYYAAFTMGAVEGRFSGLDRIDGVGLDHNPTRSETGPAVTGRPYKVVASVRTAGDSVQIGVSVGGRPVVQWSGNLASLGTSALWKLPELMRPGVGVQRGAVAFHQARLRVASGKAVKLEPGQQPQQTLLLTAMHGGRGPTLNGDFAPPDAMLVGFRLRIEQNPDDPEKRRIGAMEPVYKTARGNVPGRHFGTNEPATTEVLAKEGYAVGAVATSTGTYVDGMSVTFMRVGDGRLDPDDAYESPWFGGQSGGGTQTLSAGGRPIVGVQASWISWVVCSIGFVLPADEPP